MFKRIMLTLTFIAAFGTAGLGLSNQAEAWRGGRGGYYRPYNAFYAPRAVYYGPSVVPYRAYYGPRVVRPYYPVYYSQPYYAGYYPDYYYNGPRSGVSVSFGF